MNIELFSNFLKDASKSIFNFFSVTTMAAFRLANAIALWNWWFSATFGEGIKIAGLPTQLSSDSVAAPALEIIISETSIRSIKLSIKSTGICPIIYLYEDSKKILDNIES